MPLGEFSIICFGFLSDFLEKNRKKEQRKKLGKKGPLRHSKGHPRCGVALHRSEGCLATTRLKG